MPRTRTLRPRARVAPGTRSQEQAPFALRVRAGLLVAAGVAVYWNSLALPLLFDDELSIVSNGHIRQLWPLTSVFSTPRGTPVAGRPMVNLSFALNYALSGLDVRSYHAVNIAIHVCAALLLFGIVRRTLGSPALAPRFDNRSTDLAWAAALLWVLHPLQTEAVDYLTERTESLMALFYLLTLYCAVRALERTGGRKWQLASAAACAAGMACKESMVTAPLIIVLYDRIFFFDSFKSSLQARWRLYAALAATWVVLVALMLPGPRAESVGLALGTSAWTYLLNQAQMIVRYLGLSVWPRSLVLDYGLPRALAIGDVLVPGILVGSLIVATVAALAINPPLGFLGVWFFVLLAPTTSIIPIVTEVGAERRMYLPLAGLIVLAVVAASWLGDRLERRFAVAIGPRARRAAERIALVIVCALLAVGTVLRNREYASRLGLAETIVARRPHGRAYYELGTELLANGRHDEAMAQLAESAKDYPGARYALGTELILTGRTQEGVDELERFLRASPAHANTAPARDMIGQVRIAEGRLDEASTEFEQILKDSPTYIDAHAHLGDVRLMQRQARAAIEQYEAFLQFRPSSAQVHANLGTALAASGRLDEAVAHFERAVDVDPHNADLERRLVMALVDVGRPVEAVRRAGAAVQFRPGDAAAHALFGTALASARRLDEAIVEFRRALEIDPSFGEARQSLELTVRARRQTTGVRD